MTADLSNHYGLLIIPLSLSPFLPSPPSSLPIFLLFFPLSLNLYSHFPRKVHLSGVPWLWDCVLASLTWPQTFWASPSPSHYISPYNYKIRDTIQTDTHKDTHNSHGNRHTHLHVSIFHICRHTDMHTCKSTNSFEDYAKIFLQKKKTIATDLLKIDIVATMYKAAVYIKYGHQTMTDATQRPSVYTHKHIWCNVYKHS